MRYYCWREKGVGRYERERVCATAYVKHVNLNSRLLEALEETLCIVKLLAFLGEDSRRQLVVVTD